MGNVSTHELTDQQWQTVARLFPRTRAKKGGRPQLDNRTTINGILWILATGANWNRLPKKYGSAMTCWRRFDGLQKQGIWKLIWKRYANLLTPQQKEIWHDALEAGFFTPVK